MTPTYKKKINYKGAIKETQIENSPMKYTTEINISESIKTFQKMESRIQKENEKKRHSKCRRN